MSANSNAQRLAIVPSGEEFNSEGRVPPTVEPTVCAFCYGTGMEVMPGKGARCCRCRSHDVQMRLFEASCIPRRYCECSLSNYQPTNNNGSQLLAFNQALEVTQLG